MHPLYRLSGYAAGVAVLAIAGAILVQIAGRLFGVNLFGMVEIATYALVAATFVALPYTLQTGGHIRVLVLVNRIKGRPRQVIEIACFLIALAFAVYFAWYCADLTLTSYRKGSRAQGMLSAPLWIPQLIMCVGVAGFAAAVLHRLVDACRGRMDLARDETESL